MLTVIANHPRDYFGDFGHHQSHVECALPLSGGPALDRAERDPKALTALALAYAHPLKQGLGAQLLDEDLPLFSLTYRPLCNSNYFLPIMHFLLDIGIYL